MTSLPSTQEDQSGKLQSINFDTLSKRVFSEKGKTLFMGGEEIKDTIRDVLKDQAKYLETSQLYEILLATLKNEAANLAVIQSQNWEQVQFAKALHHVTYVIENIITKLSK